VQIRRKQLVASSQLYKALGGGDSLKQEASDKKIRVAGGTLGARSTQSALAGNRRHAIGLTPEYS
jgi:hypothetical protein